MADKFTLLAVEALRRAASDPGGVALFAGKQTPGLFAPSATARQVAQRCKDEGLVRVLRTDQDGKTPQEICAITSKGLHYLMEQVSPRQVLEDLVRAVEAREEQCAELQTTLRHTQASLDGLKDIAALALQSLAGTGGTWLEVLPRELERRRATSGGDYPLPELHRALMEAQPDLTIGQFHDGLRRLHDQGRIYLHPWTGPLYDLPEPPFALLVGHEIAYYASAR